MCGIAGLHDARDAIGGTEAQRAVLGSMTRSLAHRGPDAEGLWVDPEARCALGNRRLSVIDPSDAGRQPMVSFDGRWVLAYNGEIYNFAELRHELEQAGVAFRGRSDTEVLADAIASWGPSVLPRLDGMFAFAAFDTASGELLLARDAFGEKPLYYALLGAAGVAFGSELRALEAVPGFDGRVDPEALAELLLFEYVGAPRSIYAGVRKLPPGHLLRLRPGGAATLERWFSFRPDLVEPLERPIGILADELEALLVESLRRRMVADVPLGAFLSGGVDSSTACALIRRRLGVPLETFSIGFAEAPESEHAVAAAYARHLGTVHRERLLVPDDLSLLGGIGMLLDEPNGDWSCLPVYLLSRFARESVTVAISGDGGDELFGGYDRYLAALDRAGREPGGDGAAYYGWGLLAADEAAIVELLGQFPRATGEHVATLRAGIDRGEGSLLARLRRSDVENYLPGAVLAKVDRMSMQHSLEVRTPYLSPELARFAESLPQSAMVGGGIGKRVLREVAYRHLPRELVDLPKKGFGLPSREWARDAVRSVASRLLGDDESRLRSFFGAEAVDRLLARPKAVARWWTLAVLESWLRHHPATLPERRAGRAQAVHPTTGRGR